ncbi:FMN-dependent NADH-azoreductase [Mycoplasmoides pirum]|uniref:FMN-dependent NADH-azoreductase n=1 Tax=Mycoplasmoides pirum TaxID=2122 RepID=UPI0004809910|nr:FMN-dependent NADH-azoreductase [Mycoplasmoides pirum]
MNKVLVIKSSMIQESKSFSISLLNSFLKYYKQKNPNDEIIELDLNNEMMSNKNLNVNNFGTFFNQEDSDKYINQLKEVNKVIIASPMTNFNYPATLKNYLDHILVADKTFSYKYTKKGEAKGLLPHLKVQLLTTQGAPFGWYPWGNHTEMLKGTWEFVGAEVVEPLLIAGTKVDYFQKEPSAAIHDYDEKIKLAAEKF